MIDADLRGDLQRTFAAALDHEDARKGRDELLSAGWLDALQDDEPVAVALVFRLQGEMRREAAALDDVVVHHLAARWPAVAGDVAVAYPVGPPRERTFPTRHVVFGAHQDADRLLWVEDLLTDGLELVEIGTGALDTMIGGVDPSMGLVGLPGRPDGPMTDFTGEAARVAWDEAVAAGRIAVAHQLIAGAQALLSRAVEYARARRQFNTPIGSFQAVKHRLSETLVAIAAADAATVAAATTRSSAGAAVAKVLAGRAAAVAGKNCLQVFGGIGFTTEHDFHRYFRRNLVLERLLGDGRTIERQLGTALRTGRLAHERLIDLDDMPVADLLGPPGQGSP